MSESWVRLWSGMTTDPKWQTIARKSGQPRCLVIALFAHLMTIANESENRGDISSLSIEDTASAMDCDEEQVEAIINAMQDRVIADGRLSGWEERQPVREDAITDGAKPVAQRVREFRQRKLEQKQTDVTRCNACNADVTQRNAPEAEAETDLKPSGSPAATANLAREDAAAAPPRNFLQERAVELTVMLREQGASLQASDPRVRKWASSDVTDAQVIAALAEAKRRRDDQGSKQPVNAGLIDAIMSDGPVRIRAGPRRSIHDERKETLDILTGRHRHGTEKTESRDITGEAVRIA